MKTKKMCLTALAIAMMVGACGTPPTPIPAQEFICKGATVMVNPESGTCEARFVNIPDGGVDTEIGGLLGPIELPNDNAIGVAELKTLLDETGPVPVYVRTVMKGTEPEDLKAYLTGFITMDGKELLFLETDPTDKRWAAVGGLPAGASGSPTIVLGRNAGASSYGFGMRIEAPYVFASTPIKEMLKQETASNFMYDECLPERPVSGLITVGGPAARILGPLMGLPTTVTNPFSSEPLFSRMGLNGGGSMGFALGGEAATFVPGSAFAMHLISGPFAQMYIICTVTAIEGDSMWGCGHPVFGSGEVAIPFGAAYIYGVNTDYFFGPYKLGVPVGPLLGTIKKDVARAVVGKLGVFAPTISVQSTIGMEGESATKYPPHFVTELSNQGEYYSPAYHVAFAAMAPFMDKRGFDAGGSLMFTTLVTFAKVKEDDAAEQAQTATLVNAVSDGNSLLQEGFYQMYEGLNEVFDIAAKTERKVKTVETTIVWSNVQKSFEILSVALPPNAPPIMAGQSTTVVVSYYEDGKKVERKLNVIIEVPADFPAGDASLTVRRARNLDLDPEPTTLEGLIAELNAQPRNIFLAVKLTNQNWPADGSARISVTTPPVDTGKYIKPYREAYLQVEVGAPTPSTDGGMPADSGTITDGGTPETDGGTLDAGTP